MTMLFNDGKFARDEQNGQKIYVYEKKKKKICIYPRSQVSVCRTIGPLVYLYNEQCK